MKTRWLYYTASVLLAFFAIGHQLGFRKVDPTWHANEVVASMQQTHFTVQGFDRSYWSFFSGFGLFSTAFLLFSSLLALELGRLGEARGALEDVRKRMESRPDWFQGREIAEALTIRIDALDGLATLSFQPPT